MCPIARCYGSAKFSRITHAAIAVEPHIFAPTCDDDVATQIAPQAAQGLTQRHSGVAGVVFGPEQAKEGVPAVEAVRAGDGQIREQGNPLGVLEHSRGRESVGLPDVQGA